MLACAVILALLGESLAEAAFLKNGARPRSGDRLQTLKPPRAGSRNRIRAPNEPRMPTTGKRRGKQQHAWFWKIHSTAVGSASAERWGGAISTFASRHASGQRLSSESTLTKILESYSGEIKRAAGRARVSEALLLAVIAVESRGHLNAVSPKGAKGLMQLIPATARRFGVSNAFDAGQNIDGGAAYLDWLLREFRGDVLLALAGYNAGEGAVRKHKGVPPYAETRDYVVKVMDAVTQARSLCTVPPETPRSRCTWRTGI